MGLQESIRQAYGAPHVLLLKLIQIMKPADMLDTLIAHLQNGWGQEDRLLRLTTTSNGTSNTNAHLLAESFKGVESLNDGFRFEITALSTDAHIELKTLLGQPVLLELLTAHSRTELRPFHGHITSLETVGSNGGLARYRLIVEPWTAMLAMGRDSTTYQDMTVFQILDAIFQDYQGQGTLSPQWRLEIADTTIYPKRSLTTQYQESDLAFIQRLLLEEGIFTWIEHQGDATSPTLGSHTLVIADHNGAFQPNVQAQIDYTQPGAMMRRDSIDRWRSQRRWQTNGIELQSWDYRQINTRPLQSHSANGNNDGSDGNMPLVSQDTPGSYSYESREQGQRIANHQLQALEAHNKLLIGAGTVRTLSPGTRFTLNGQSAAEWDQSDDDRNFVILRVVHQAHNNLSADLQAHVAQSLGLPHQDVDIDTDADANTDTDTQAPSLFHNLTNADQQKGERPLYRNRIDAIRSNIPYRPLGTDAHGKRLHPKPTVQGQQTAIVVGPQGEVIHTDRDHRIKVQFHWMRGGSNGSNSHSRLQHPNPDGHTGAPANDHSGTWVRVAATLAPIAGANWGSHTIPRIGQEVLVDFIEGDIDRPLVIGTLYNGQGQADAQYNQQAQGTGSATGNAPAWFPGQTDDGSNGHAHPAALSGIKTQAMSASQQGTGSYNQLVFDDSPNESRTSLQSHANPHEGSSELNLGHLRHQTDNQRLSKVGFGAELKTQHSVALRAGQGLLISTDARTNASSSQLDSKEAQAQLDSSHTLQQSLAQTAQQHKAKLKDDQQQDEPAPEKLPAIQQQANTLKVLQATQGNSDSDANNGGQGKVTAYSEPHLQLSSPAGIAAVTPANLIVSSGHTSSITASQDINFAVQGQHIHAVKAGISLFTYGKISKTNTDKPNQETGIRLHAASGKVSSQSQSAETKLTADKAIQVNSITNSITIAAPEHVLLTAQGAYIKLEGGNIMVHGPGTMAFKASAKELAGPGSSSPELPLLPKYEGDQGDQHFILKSHDGTPIKNRRYRASTGNQVIEGFTDNSGRSKILDGFTGQLARFELIDESFDEHFILKDPLGKPITNMRYRIKSDDGIEIEGVTDSEGHTLLFTSDKVEKVELFYIDENIDDDQGAD